MYRIFTSSLAYYAIMTVFAILCVFIAYGTINGLAATIILVAGLVINIVAFVCTVITVIMYWLENRKYR